MQSNWWLKLPRLDWILSSSLFPVLLLGSTIFSFFLPLSLFQFLTLSLTPSLSSSLTPLRSSLSLFHSLYMSPLLSLYLQLTTFILDRPFYFSLPSSLFLSLSLTHTLQLTHSLSLPLTYAKDILSIFMHHSFANGSNSLSNFVRILAANAKKTKSKQKTGSVKFRNVFYVKILNHCFRFEITSQICFQKILLQITWKLHLDLKRNPIRNISLSECIDSVRISKLFPSDALL